MPVYEYRCPGCGKGQELLLAWSKAKENQYCECGQVMQRLMSVPLPAIFVQTNRGKVLNTLNKEEKGFVLPGGDMHRARYSKALAKGLDRTRPVIGRGL